MSGEAPPADRADCYVSHGASGASDRHMDTTVPAPAPAASAPGAAHKGRRDVRTMPGAALRPGRGGGGGGVGGVSTAPYAAREALTTESRAVRDARLSSMKQPPSPSEPSARFPWKRLRSKDAAAPAVANSAPPFPGSLVVPAATCERDAACPISTG